MQNQKNRNELSVMAFSIFPTKWKENNGGKSPKLLDIDIVVTDEHGIRKTCCKIRNSDIAHALTLFWKFHKKLPKGIRVLFDGQDQLAFLDRAIIQKSVYDYEQDDCFFYIEDLQSLFRQIGLTPENVNRLEYSQLEPIIYDGQIYPREHEKAMAIAHCWKRAKQELKSPAQ